MSSHTMIATAVREYIARHYDDPDIELASIVADYGWSRRTIERALAEHGPNWRDLLWRYRMSIAAIRLRVQPDRNIADIAHSVGYRSASQFTRAFTRCYGVQPRRYRDGQNG